MQKCEIENWISIAKVYIGTLKRKIRKSMDNIAIFGSWDVSSTQQFIDTKFIDTFKFDKSVFNTNSVYFLLYNSLPLLSYNLCVPIGKKPPPALKNSIREFIKFQ